MSKFHQAVLCIRYSMTTANGNKQTEREETSEMHLTREAVSYSYIREDESAQAYLHQAIERFRPEDDG
jgi:hypothetical protein